LKSEEQLEEWLNMAALRHTDARGDVSRASLAWRRHRDVYWLDRERPEWYRNNTVSDNVVAHADTRQTLSAQWALALRADAELERIDGRYRGTLASVPMGHHLRRRAEVAAVPSYTLGDWTFSLGGGAGWHSAPDEKCYLLPAAGAAWKLAPGQTLFANYTESIRRPSYLELNYESPSSLGNQGLKHQHSRVFEAGWEGASREAKGRVTAFADETKNAVDWLLDRSSGRWVAENVPRVTTLGLATSGEVKADDATEFFAGAAWLWKHPVIDVRLGVRQKIGSRLRCELTHNFWHQARNRAREGGRSAHVLDVSASYEFGTCWAKILSPTPNSRCWAARRM
jgi:outer membrane receptor protein involved in Fe transport